MKTIDFKYYMSLQARYLKQISQKLEITPLEAAFLFSAIMRMKLQKKYIIK